MKQKNLNNIINQFLIVFLIIQPIFDLKFFYNSISTLIRVIIIYTLFAYYFFTSKNKKKYYLLIYPVLIGIYFIFHHLNAINFYSLVPGNFNYSILEEALYFVKMLSPFLLIYCLYKSNFTVDKMIDIMKYLVLIIGITIVVSNLFVFSYGSYSDVPIKANFFEWFNPNSEYVYQDLASKGLFEYGNQISAILIMFLPFITYSALQKHNILHWFVLGLNVFSLILLCTKVSVLGILVVIFYTLFAFVFVSLIRKKHINIKNYVPIVFLLVIYCLLLPVNPMLSRIQERTTIAEHSEIEVSNEYSSNIVDNKIIENTQIIEGSNVDDDSETKISEIPNNVSTPQSDSDEINPIIKYIEDNYASKQLHEPFIFEYYPYNYDPEFWYDFLQNDMSSVTDYRFVELSIIKRVVELNNSKMDKWFGITNTRLQNIFNIERDFVVQYYALGIIGTLLVFAPYFVLLGIYTFNLLKNKFKNLNILNLSAFITILFLFCTAYITGNLLNSLSFTLYFSFCFYLLTK